MFIVWDMSRAIQSGEIIMHLLKPMRYRVYTFWSYSGSHVISFFLTFIPTFIVVVMMLQRVRYHWAGICLFCSITGSGPDYKLQYRYAGGTYLSLYRVNLGNQYSEGNYSAASIRVQLYHLHFSRKDSERVVEYMPFQSSI